MMKRPSILLLMALVCFGACDTSATSAIDTHPNADTSTTGQGDALLPGAGGMNPGSGGAGGESSSRGGAGNGGKAGSGKDIVPPTESFKVSPANVALAVGAKVQLSAARFVAGAATKDITRDVTWLSSSRKIVAVGSTPGEVTGVFPGSAQVTATLAGQGNIGTVNVTVTAAAFPSAPQRLILSPLRSTIDLNRSIDLSAQLRNADGTTADVNDAVVWSTTTPVLLAVKANANRATCLADGEGVVTATLGNLAARAFVTCESAVPLVSLSLLPSFATLLIGETLFPRLHGTFADGTVRDLSDVATWRLVPPPNGARAKAKQVGPRSFLAVFEGEDEIEATFGSAVAISNLEVLRP
jgi:hypothetical protein